jgi:hypothetical protein
MYSTLLPNEEPEPDFEDREGKLYWSNISISGEGLGVSNENAMGSLSWYCQCTETIHMVSKTTIEEYLFV